MNEVIPWSRRAAATARRSAVASRDVVARLWGRFTDRAEETTGRQRVALLALSRTAEEARAGQEFDASSALSSYGDACF